MAIHRYLERTGPIGDLARATQAIMTVFGAAINEIAEGTGSLSSSSAKLSADSALVLKGARGASERAHTVASASEQVNATVRAVAAGMDEAATNLNAVASSTETDDRCH